MDDTELQSAIGYCRKEPYGIIILIIDFPLHIHLFYSITLFSLLYRHMGL